MINRIQAPPVIPEFHLTCCCGRGSSSEVWLGTDRRGFRRAVRIVSKRRQPALLEAERKAIALYRSRAGTHSHLLEILDAGETAEYLYCVTEPADNCCRSKCVYEPDTLAKRMRHHAWTMQTVCSYVDALLAGVEQLHSGNIAHHDLKPENILFVRNVLKIADPGLVSGSEAKSIGGTAGFRPPWNATGKECDIYAVGKLIYMLCTGEGPDRFPEIPDHCDFGRFFPLNEISLCCCERNPLLRFRNISEIRCAFDRIRTA